jgi:nitrogen-specific signal transduction histidine kinase
MEPNPLQMLVQDAAADARSFEQLVPAELARANETQFKDDFLSHVSHELRSPLNSIYQFVTILLDRLAGDLNAQQSAYLEIVVRNVQHLQSMINDMFAAADLKNGQLLIEPQPNSLGDAILDTVKALQFTAAAKKIDLSAELIGPLPQVFADPIRLRQILSILVENAIKFTPDQGTVKITARARDRELLMEIADSGCGIHTDLFERIFEHMFQAPDPELPVRKGLGLGLSICKDLVNRQGGAIGVTSTPGIGSVFSVTLPVFRLEDYLQPVVRWGAPFTLLVTEVVSPTGWLSHQARTKHGSLLREHLEQLLFPDRAVLLPRMGSSGGVELFFVVAAGNNGDLRKLVTRIHDGLDSVESLQQSGLTYSTVLRPLLDDWSAPADAVEIFAETLEAEIQQRIDKEILQRMVRDGQ